MSSKFKGMKFTLYPLKCERIFANRSLVSSMLILFTFRFTSTLSHKKMCRMCVPYSMDKSIHFSKIAHFACVCAFFVVPLQEIRMHNYV